VAISSVFLFHLAGELGSRSGRSIPFEPRYHWLQTLIGNGDRGVGLFFVISGMILAMPFARHFLAGGRPVSLRKYYLRRLTRLEPPYLLSMAIILGMEVAYTHGWTMELMRHAAASAVYLHNPIYRQLSWVNPVTWSLEVEVQFYILAPLAMQVFRIPNRSVRRGLLAVAIVGIGLAQMPYLDVPWVSLSIVKWVQYFLAGLLIADIFVLDLEGMRSRWTWDVAGVLALVGMFEMTHEAPWAHVALPVLVCVLFLAAMRSFGLRRVLGTPWVAVVGGMCYSIYLFHFVFIAALFKGTRHLILARADFVGNLLIQLVVTGIPVLVLCGLFFVLVERPCMDPDWPSKLWRRITGRRMVELDSEGIS
jgi:peptidoglycan/LPS O-acetylase OafA/YrhL